MVFGTDCVSGNEVRKAIETGVDPRKIVLAGVGKSEKGITYALNNDIFTFNVESIQELEVIDALATALGKNARVALRINPNVDAHTHQYITTGLDENKFGIAHWELTGAIETLRRCQRIELVGIHFRSEEHTSELTSLMR